MTTGEAQVEVTFIDVDVLARAASHQGGGAVLAIGIFDGVHIGHQSLLRAGLGEARRIGAAFETLTFWPHPEVVLGSRAAGATASTEGFLLSTLEERVGLLAAGGVGRVHVLRFTPEAAAVDPGEFVRRTLVNGLRPRAVVVGFNFTFGAGGRGRPPLLRELGRRAEFAVTIHPAVRLGGEVVSSSTVRAALAAGDVDRAGLLLGRPYSLAGRVRPGVGRGRKLGFPTANVAFPPDMAPPARGVYVAAVTLGTKPILDAARALPAVANVGVCPTFAPSSGTGGETGGSETAASGLRLEAHLLQGPPPSCGDEVRVFFLRRLRPERRFPGPEELAHQIAQDREKALAFFGRGIEARG